MEDLSQTFRVHRRWIKGGLPRQLCVGEAHPEVAPRRWQTGICAQETELSRRGRTQTATPRSGNQTSCRTRRSRLSRHRRYPRRCRDCLDRVAHLAGRGTCLRTPRRNLGRRGSAYLVPVAHLTVGLAERGGEFLYPPATADQSIATRNQNESAAQPQRNSPSPEEVLREVAMAGWGPDGAVRLALRGHSIPANRRLASDSFCIGQRHWLPEGSRGLP